jgi:hypothetical protein
MAGGVARPPLPRASDYRGRARVEVKTLYLLTTDLELTPLEAVQAYGGRQQIEVNFDEVKELGLGHYQGRSGEGVRRWPVFLCIAHALLKLLATQALHIELSALNGSWYKRENTTGQVRRRLTAACRPPISRDSGVRPYYRENEESGIISTN